ncbi:13853_t:CDS:2, partial [Dentiscutata heterogama]
NIEDEFYLTCYGKDFMKTLIKLKDDKLIRSLGQSCLEKCVQNDNHLISKISLLNIIFENFNDLSDNHPAFIASMLTNIGFVVPSTTVNTNSTSSHLSSYGRYCQLSKTQYLDILISSLWIRWNSFFQKDPKHFLNFQNTHNSIILAIPLPNFVSYPKKYNFWKELLKPSPNSFTYSNKIEAYSTDPNDPWNLATTYNTIDSNGTIEENSSLIEPPTTTTNMFMLMGSAIAAETHPQFLTGI